VFPSPTAQTDFQGIRYAEWVERNRDWFWRRFPEVFRLADALAQEGVNVEYPDLLFDSGLVWQFAWPPAESERLLEADSAAIIRAANRHGKDSQWLSDRGLLPGLADPPVRPESGMGAFSQWQKEFAAVSGIGEMVPPELLLNSLQACDYLRHTRLLIWLAIESNQCSTLNPPTEQLQPLLLAEIAKVNWAISEASWLLLAEWPTRVCNIAPYQESLGKLTRVITQLAQVEARLADTMFHLRSQTSPEDPGCASAY